MTNTTFDGFVPPTKNFFQMPNNWIDICAQITNLSELKVVQYVLRHTWGFHEYGKPKAISVDEFMRGRKRDDSTRMDKGTGLSNHSVIDGLKAAIKHGFLVCEIDTSDLARIKKSYSLKMASPSEDSSPHENNTQGEESTSSSEDSSSRGATSSYPSEESSYRSEKDTYRKTLKKNTKEKQEEANAFVLTHAQTKQQSFAYSHDIKGQTEIVESTDYKQELKPVDPPSKPDKPASRQRKPKVEQPVLVDTSKKAVAFNEAEQRVFDWYCGCDFIHAKPEQDANKKKHCGKLAPHVHSQEEMQSLADFTKTWLKGHFKQEVYVVPLGNMAYSDTLNAWIAKQKQTKRASEPAAPQEIDLNKPVLWTRYQHTGPAIKHWFLYEDMPLVEAQQYGYKADVIVPNDRRNIRTSLKALAEGHQTLTPEEQNEKEHAELRLHLVA